MVLYKISAFFFSRSLQFLKKFTPVALYRRFYRKSSTRIAENSPAERKLGSFGNFQAQNEGKDIYPYPIGYQALCNYVGHIYEMEIQEGAKGPVFVTKGFRATGKLLPLPEKNPEER